MFDTTPLPSVEHSESEPSVDSKLRLNASLHGCAPDLPGQLLQGMDESGTDPASFRELLSATDLALCTTKAMAQSLGARAAFMTDTHGDQGG